MKDLIEIGKISSRGQIAIPLDIRERMGLEEGAKILFLLDNDTLLIKRINQQTFAQITKPLKEAANKAGMKEENVPELIHKFRSSKK